MSIQERVNAQKSAAAEISAAKQEAEKALAIEQLSKDLETLVADFASITEYSDSFDTISDQDSQVAIGVKNLKANRQVLRDLHSESVSDPDITELPKPYEMIASDDFESDTEIVGYTDARSNLRASLEARAETKSKFDTLGLVPENGASINKDSVQVALANKKAEIQQYVIDNPELKTEQAEQIRTELVSEKVNQSLETAKKSSITNHFLKEIKGVFSGDITSLLAITPKSLVLIKEEFEKQSESSLRTIEKRKQAVTQEIIKAFISDDARLTQISDIFSEQQISGGEKANTLNNELLVQTLKQIIFNYKEIDGVVGRVIHKYDSESGDRLVQFYEAASGITFEKDQGEYSDKDRKESAEIFTISEKSINIARELLNLKSKESNWDKNASSERNAVTRLQSIGNSLQEDFVKEEQRSQQTEANLNEKKNEVKKHSIELTELKVKVSLLPTYIAGIKSKEHEVISIKEAVSKLNIEIQEVTERLQSAQEAKSKYPTKAPLFGKKAFEEGQAKLVNDILSLESSRKSLENNRFDSNIATHTIEGEIRDLYSSLNQYQSYTDKNNNILESDIVETMNTIRMNIDTQIQANQELLGNLENDIVIAKSELQNNKVNLETALIDIERARERLASYDDVKKRQLQEKIIESRRQLENAY
jgi:hypothetical protein